MTREEMIDEAVRRAVDKAMPESKKMSGIGMCLSWWKNAAPATLVTHVRSEFSAIASLDPFPKMG